MLHKLIPPVPLPAGTTRRENDTPGFRMNPWDMDPVERLLNTFIAYADSQNGGFVIPECTNRTYLQTVAGVAGKGISFYLRYLSPPTARLVTPVLTRSSPSPLGRRYRYRVDGNILNDLERRQVARDFVNARLQELERGDSAWVNLDTAGEPVRSVRVARRSYRSCEAIHGRRYIRLMLEVANILGLEATLSIDRADWLTTQVESRIPRDLWLDVESAWCDRRMQVLRTGFPDPTFQFFDTVGRHFDIDSFDELTDTRTQPNKTER